MKKLRRSLSMAMTMVMISSMMPTYASGPIGIVNKQELVQQIDGVINITSTTESALTVTTGSTLMFKQDPIGETLLEFEDVLPKGAKVEKDVNASGGKLAGATENKEFIFDNLPASDTFSIYYGCGRSASATDNIVVSTKMSEETGWQQMGLLTYSPNGSWWMKPNDLGIITMSGLEIPEGASLKLVPSNSINLDCLVLSKKGVIVNQERHREAETADCGSTKMWRINRSPAASGGGVAGYTGGCSFIFRNLPASNKIAMKYANINSGSVIVDLLVDGAWQRVGGIDYATTQSWDIASGNEVYSGGVYIPEGGSIRITAPEDIDLDYFRFLSEPLNQEKDLSRDIVLAKNSEGGGLESDLMSLVGTVTKLNQADTLKFKVPDLNDLDIYTIGYRAEQEVRVQVQVDEGVVQEIILPATKPYYYGTVGQRDVVGLTPGAEITLKVISEGELFVDYLSFRSAPVVDEALEVSTNLEVGERNIINMDGIWLCTSSLAINNPEKAIVPIEFNNTIPVPGLWDQAAVDMGGYASKSLWYQQFIIMPDDFDATNPGVTIDLELLRAQYGRSIYINGKYIDSYPYNFTNSTTDITPYLVPGKNSITIMLGNASTQQNDPDCPAHTGTDMERSLYYPGMTDSVNLIVRRDPAVTSVQTAANLEGGSVQVRVKVENGSDTTVTTDVTINVYERGIFKNGQSEKRVLVGSYTVPSVEIDGYDKIQLDVPSISLKDFDESKAWTPTCPYLYEIEVKTSGDTLSKRFGMRTFYFDKETKEPMLNEKIYRLLGTNVALYRFFEDTQRGGYPWEKAWVEQLYKEFKETNWEVFRTHNGPVPQFWYDLADEMGLMIVDEYAIWGCKDGCNTDTLMPEYKSMVDEKQSHPSIIYWDAQNETTNLPATGECAKILMEEGYDISNRHWDNGWDLPVDEYQPVEFHPYPFWNVGKNLDTLNSTDDQSPFNAGKNTNNKINPKIINEYASLWVNREGEATWISADNFKELLPADATNEDRINFYMKCVAYSTEFWRAGRNIAGIQQFQGLSYSKPGTSGATGDVLMPDLSMPRIKENFKERFKDAFAPLGICIKNYDIKTGPNRVHDFPVSIFNDTYEVIENLPVELTISVGGRILFSETKLYNVSEVHPKKADGSRTDTEVQNFEVKMPAAGIPMGEMVTITASYTRNGETVSSIREMEWDLAENIALGKEVIASSEAVKDNAVDVNKDKWFAKYINDGDLSQSSRWACDRVNDGKSPWITIDLEESYPINKVELVWETAKAKEYKIQISDDGEIFSDLAHVKGNKELDNSISKKDFIKDAKTSGRYIRLQCIEAATQYGYSIYEMRVFNDPELSLVPVTGVALENKELNLGEVEGIWTGQLTATVMPENATNQFVKWSSSNEKVATVNHTGMVTAHSKGEAVITVTTEDGNFTDTCIVTVSENIVPPSEVAVTGVVLETKTLNLGPLEGVWTAQLIARVMPIDATNQQVKWFSDNEEVVSVNQQGLVTAQNKGTAIITVTTEDGKFTDTCKVTVSAKRKPWPDEEENTNLENFSDNISEIIQNENGSVTKKVTNKITGEVIVTTTYPDGVKVETITQSEGQTSSFVTIPDGKDRVTVIIPTLQKPSAGVVAVSVNESNNAKKVIKSSIAVEDGIRVTLTESTKLELMDNTKKFTDIPSTGEVADTVAFVTSREIFTGTDTDTFEPNSRMTRAMIWTVLARLDGQNTNDGENWYESARQWAIERGISDGSAPNEMITIEQLAAILWRYAGELKTKEDIIKFTDFDRVAEYAKEAMIWAIEVGVINETDREIFSSKEKITRIQIASILRRYCEAYFK